VDIIGLEIEWDEDKRAKNIAKHDLDLIDGRKLFDGRLLYNYPSFRKGEFRRVSVGNLDGRMVALVWMERNGIARLISLRSARDGEKRKYRSLQH
jgi:uncharacterized DUF497 family protein